MKDLFVSALLDVYGGCLSEKQRTLTDFYYNDDLSLSEIAENEGMTRQGVNGLIKRGVSQLKSLEDEYGYCRSFLELKELSAKVRNGETQNIDRILDIIDNM